MGSVHGSISPALVAWIDRQHKVAHICENAHSIDGLPAFCDG